MRLTFMTLSPALSLRRYAPAPSRREQFSFIVACLHMTIARSAATWGNPYHRPLASPLGIGAREGTRREAVGAL